MSFAEIAVIHSYSALQQIYKNIFSGKNILLQSKTFYICPTINFQKTHYEQSRINCKTC
jgi:hypothetical protein